MQKSNTFLAFEPTEFVFDLASFDLPGEIIQSKNSLVLSFDSGDIDLFAFFSSPPFKEALLRNELLYISQKNEIEELIIFDIPQKSSKSFLTFLSVLNESY